MKFVMRVEWASGAKLRHGPFSWQDVLDYQVSLYQTASQERIRQITIMPEWAEDLELEFHAPQEVAVGG